MANEYLAVLAFTRATALRCTTPDLVAFSIAEMRAAAAALVAAASVPAAAAARKRILSFAAFPCLPSAVGPTEKISSLQNPRVKLLVRLRDRRPRDEEGVFLVEGYREIRRALDKGVTLRELHFSPSWFLGTNEPALLAEAAARGAQLFELSREAFAKVAYRERPDGLLAVAPQWHRSLADLTLPKIVVASSTSNLRAPRSRLPVTRQFWMRLRCIGHFDMIQPSPT